MLAALTRARIFSLNHPGTTFVRRASYFVSCFGATAIVEFSLTTHVVEYLNRPGFPTVTNCDDPAGRAFHILHYFLWLNFQVALFKGTWLVGPRPSPKVVAAPRPPAAGEAAPRVRGHAGGPAFPHLWRRVSKEMPSEWTEPSYHPH